jgi:hypothetical protein
VFSIDFVRKELLNRNQTATRAEAEELCSTGVPKRFLYCGAVTDAIFYFKLLVCQTAARFGVWHVSAPKLLTTLQ